MSFIVTLGTSYRTVSPNTGIGEIDWHESKSFLILETKLEGIRIYDRDSKQEYKLRECNKEKCETIHLESKSDYTVNGSIRLAPYLLNNTMPTITR